MKNRILFAALGIAVVAVSASLLTVGASLKFWQPLAMLLRWVAILVLVQYSRSRAMPTMWIFIGLIAGAEFGHDWPSAAKHLQLLGIIFLRLVKVIVVPLLVGTLIVGIAGHADLRKLGRLGIKSLIYFEIISTIALLFGFVAINLSGAGYSVHLPNTIVADPLRSTSHSVADVVANIFPESFVKAAADGQILQVVIFSIVFSISLAMVPQAKRQPLLDIADSLSETMFKFTSLVMYLAPVGVFGAIAYTVGSLGLGVFVPLMRVVATVYIALAAFILCILLPIAVAFGVPLKRFLRAAAEPITIAFATASSEAALPRAIQQMESLGVPHDTAAFVLPTGYSFNLDGSSIYQSVALVFVAQAAGISLSIGQQLMMFLALLVSSKGTAGVARASLVIVMAVATSFHFPPEPLYVLFAIDQFLDMGRTGVNMLGNCLACVVLSKWEGESISG